MAWNKGVWLVKVVYYEVYWMCQRCRMSAVPIKHSTGTRRIHWMKIHIITSFASINRFYLHRTRNVRLFARKQLKGKTNIPQLVNKFANFHSTFISCTMSHKRIYLVEVKNAGDPCMRLHCVFVIDVMRRARYLLCSTSRRQWIFTAKIHAARHQIVRRMRTVWLRVWTAIDALLYFCLHRKHFSRLQIRSLYF